jgi:hypothetical protein
MSIYEISIDVYEMFSCLDMLICMCFAIMGC